MSSADHPLADLYVRSEHLGVGSGYTSPVSRARIARWFIGLAVGADALSLLALASQRALLDRGVGQITLAEWHRSDARVGAVELIGIALLLVGAITFLRWLHLAYRNLRELHVESRFTPGWAVGYWFVPVFNLWRPKQILDELWRSTDRARSVASTRLIPLWWLLFITSNLVYRFATIGSEDTIGDLKRRNLALGISHAMTLTAGLCLFVLVGRLTRRQDEAAARLDAERTASSRL